MCFALVLRWFLYLTGDMALMVARAIGGAPFVCYSVDKLQFNWQQVG